MTESLRRFRPRTARRSVFVDEHLRDHRGEPSVAEDEDACRSRRIVDPLGNLARRRDELGEGGLLVAQAAGTTCRFSTGRARYSAKAPFRPLMPRTPRAAQCLPSPARHAAHRPAGNVDLADDAFSDEPLRGRGDDGADEFVPRNAAERHVAPQDLEVGRADAREMHLDERFAARRGRGVRLRVDEQSSFCPVENERLHSTNDPAFRVQTILSGTERSPAGSFSRAAMRRSSPGPMFVTACATPGRIRTHLRLRLEVELLQLAGRGSPPEKPFPLERAEPFGDARMAVVSPRRAGQEWTMWIVFGSMSISFFSHGKSTQPRSSQCLHSSSGYDSICPPFSP